MSNSTRGHKKGRSKFDSHLAYLPTDTYSTNNIFSEFETLKYWAWLDNHVNEFFETKFLPSLDKFDLIVTIDRKATTILKTKREKYPQLKEVKILKSSYVGKREEYEGKRVAIFDDSIRTGKHSIDVIRVISKYAASFRIFCIACLESGKHNVKRSLGETSSDFEIEEQIIYEDENKFNNEFGKAICAYMLHLQIPSDKDHFYVECVLEERKEPSRANGSRSMDFIEILREMGTEPFIINDDMWNENRLKISSHFQNLVEVENIQPRLKFKKGMTFKMRIFLRLDESKLFFVPIPMDLIILRSWREKIRLPTEENCNLEVRLCDCSEKNAIDLDLYKHKCEECVHLNLKLRFLKYFLSQLDEILSRKTFRILITRTRWDKVEGNYPTVRIHDIMNDMVKGMINIESRIEPDSNPALI
jgi:hypothetical protein